MRAARTAALTGVVVHALALAGSVSAYDIQTHRELGTLALGMSGVDGVLRSELGAPEGVLASFGGVSVAVIVHDAAGREDIPFWRSLNHFHDPIQPWDSAGLRVGPLQAESSVRWGQNPVQASGFGGGTWSWPVARRGYAGALTAASPAEREDLFAQTFRSLGQLMHLVQDSAVPAHVRNDPHPPVLNSDPYENYVGWLREKRQPSFFTMAGNLAGLKREWLPDLLNPPLWPPGLAPKARLIDSDNYLGAETDLLKEKAPALGLAEFTSGNFMSSNTRFSEAYPYPRISSLNPGFWESEGGWWRRYFSRTEHGVSVFHFAAEGLLYESIRAIYGWPLPAAYTLTDLVHQDYAQDLLPRAVAYSASLLDHFFRGRLEADLVDDPSNVGAMSAAVVNRSKEALGAGGEVSIHADDALGRRRLMGSTRLAQEVPPGGALPLVELDPLAVDGSTRLMAVYQGPLGAEQPGGGSPGAVIGKVFRPAAVEEVFAGGTGWLVRTAAGVFPMPLSVAQYEQVQWGDGDSIVVARTPFGSGQPSRVAVYGVKRDPMGRLPFRLGEGGIVEVDPPEEYAFPFGLPIGTTVRFRHTVDYRQQLARIEQRVRLRFVPDTWTYDTIEEIDFVGPDFETTVDAPGLAFEATFPIILDAEHHASQGPAGYVWDVADIAVGADGRPLALVVVNFTVPPVEPIPQPMYWVDGAGRTVLADESVSIVPQYPDGLPTIWLLVDLAGPTVLASTADALIDIDMQESRVDGPARLGAEFLGYYGRHRVTYLDGPSAGRVEVGQWLPRAFLVDMPPPTQTTDVALLGGYTALKVTGVLRPELRTALAAEGFTDHVVEITNPVTDLVYGCTGIDALGGCRAIRVHGQGGVIARTPASLDVVRRPRPDTEGRLVMLAADYSASWTGGLPLGALLVWDPRQREVPLRHRLRPASPGDGWNLPAATSRLALVTSFSFSSWPDGEPRSASMLVRLDGGAPPVTFADRDLGQAFVLLDPDRLYNTRDLKFYRSTPPLTPTPLPARLADAVPHAPGDFHVVHLP